MIYSINTISQEQLFHFLENSSPDHTPALSSVVNLWEYSQKLCTKAVIFETWEKDQLCGILAGYFNSPDSKECFITFLHVNRDYRRLGLGKILMEKAIELAREKNFQTIALMVNINNVNAISFYTRFGFATQSRTDSQIRMELKLF